MPTFAPIARRLAACTLFAASMLAGATDLRISLPLLPPLVESRDKGPLADLAKAIAREWKDGKVTIVGPVPFDRSVDNVLAGRADVHFPLIESAGRDEEDLPFRFSRATLYEVPFALYTRKDNGRVNPKQLTIAALSKLRIETERTHTRLFFFQPREAGSIEDGLKRVNAGKSDGFVFSATATDPVLKRLKLDNIERTPYRRFNSKMLLQKGPAGDEFDEKLGLIIDRLKDSGEYQKIMASVGGAAAR